MAARNSWNRYGTKLRQCQRMHSLVAVSRNAPFSAKGAEQTERLTEGEDGERLLSMPLTSVAST